MAAALLVMVAWLLLKIAPEPGGSARHPMRKSKFRTWRFLALPALATLLCAGFAAAQSPAPPTIPIGASLTLAPYSFVNENNEYVGFELDVLREAAKRMGVQFDIVRTPFAQMFASLNGGLIRIAASGIVMTCERLKNPTTVGRFSLPTFANGLVITTRTEMADKVKSFADLAGKKVGVENVGTMPDRYVVEAQKMTTFEKVVFADNPSEFLALEEGRIDAVAQLEAPTLWQTRGNARLKIAARVPGTTLPVGFVFKQDDPLREQFNTALDAMKTDGTMTKNYHTWFEADPPSDSPSNHVVPEVTAASQGCS
jgi:polar amino acid transport system substrate-binding protein